MISFFPMYGEMMRPLSGSISMFISTACAKKSRLPLSAASFTWQADHTPLDVWLLDEAGKPAKPYLTAIEDDYSRMIVEYRLSFQAATALTTALTLRLPAAEEH